MHEFGVTQSIIAGLLSQLEQENNPHVVKVRFRRSSAFSEEVLRQTFDSLSMGTPLDGAELLVDVTELKLKCEQCGQESTVSSENLVGHVFFCPICGSVYEIAEAHDLELVEVIAEMPDLADG